MTKLRTVDRVLAILAATLIGIYFFRLARPSLHNYFTADDFQILWRCWFFPLDSLVKANVLFFWTSNFDRPMVADWFRIIFHFAGLNPFWFRAANLVALGGNIFLTYSVARRLSSSREVAVIAALLFSYSRAMNYLYFDSGFTCDVLCYLFYFSTFLFYLRIRQQARFPRWWETAVLGVLYVCALNAKEIALTMPATIGIYELLWNPPKSWRPRALLGYAASEGRTALFFSLFMAAMAIGRVMGPNSLLQFEAYRPVFTWQRLILTNGTFLASAVTGSFVPWGQPAVLGVWLGLILIGWLSRRRDVRFACLFVVLSPIPVEFILPRGTPQYYVPWFGWMFLCSLLLVLPIQYLTERLWPKWTLLSYVRGTAILLALIAIRYPIYKKMGWENVASIKYESPGLQQAYNELHRLEPAVKPGAHILLLNDPIPTAWTLYLIVLVSYHDRSVFIYDQKMLGKAPDQTAMATFDYIFDYRDGHYVELRGSSAASPAQAIAR